MVPTCYRHPDRETWIRCQRCDRPICPDCMNSASVGFQCPQCVKEGARSTRADTTTYGGRRSTNPQATSVGIIAVNVAVWVLVVGSGGDRGALFQRLALLPRSTAFRFPDNSVQVVEGVSGGAVWELLTSAFTHASPTHIGFNMLAVYFLGPQLEHVLGRARFLALYLVSALVGSAVVMWLSSPSSQTIGASGAVFGMLGALLVVAVKMRADTSQLLFWLGLNLVFTVLGRGAISWQGHLGGLAGGALLAAIVVYAPRSRRSLLQWSGFAVITALALVAVAVRAAMLG